MTNHTNSIISILFLYMLSHSGSYGRRPTDTATPVITTCGGIIAGNSGTISYKVGEEYNNFERCIWTIRTHPGTMNIDFVKYPTNFEMDYDWISVFSFDEKGLNQTVQFGKYSQAMERVTMWGSVAVVVFTSDASYVRNGFVMTFNTNTNAATQTFITSHYDFNTGTVQGQIEYPENYSDYKNGDLSTFLISNGYTYGGNYLTLHLDWYDIEYNPQCVYDALLIYVMNRETLELKEKICGNSANNMGPSNSVEGNDFVLMFISDSSISGKGFRVSWEHE